MCGTIPVLAIEYYLAGKIAAWESLTVNSIIPFLYGIMHLFFIKAYLCAVKNPKEQYSK